MNGYDELTRDELLQEIWDLKDERDFLHDQIKELLFCMKSYKTALERRMTPSEFAEFNKKCAKDLFKRSVEDMEECDFKNFCMDLIERWKL